MCSFFFFFSFCPTDRPTFTKGRAMGNETFYWDGIMNLPFTSAVKNTTQTQSSTNWNLTLKSPKFTVFKERYFGPPLLNFAHEITHETFFLVLHIYFCFVFVCLFFVFASIFWIILCVYISQS